MRVLCEAFIGVLQHIERVGGSAVGQRQRQVDEARFLDKIGALFFETARDFYTLGDGLAWRVAWSPGRLLRMAKVGARVSARSSGAKPPRNAARGRRFWASRHWLGWGMLDFDGVT